MVGLARIWARIDFVRLTAFPSAHQRDAAIIFESRGHIIASSPLPSLSALFPCAGGQHMPQFLCPPSFWNFEVVWPLCAKRPATGNVLFRGSVSSVLGWHLFVGRKVSAVKYSGTCRLMLHPSVWKEPFLILAEFCVWC